MEHIAFMKSCSKHFQAGCFFLPPSAPRLPAFPPLLLQNINECKHSTGSSAPSGRGHTVLKSHPQLSLNRKKRIEKVMEHAGYSELTV